MAGQEDDRHVGPRVRQLLLELEPANARQPDVEHQAGSGASKLAWLRRPHVSFGEEFLRSNLDETSCLILDVQMKGLSGIELQERLISADRPIPIIFITAVLDEQIRNQVLEAGAIDILSKPFSEIGWLVASFQR